MRVHPHEALELMNQGHTYLDVRSESEFAQGHPAGAFNIPLVHGGPGWMQPNHDFLRVVRATFSKDTPLIVGCKTGSRSGRAAELLLAEGYHRVADQFAGWEGRRDSYGELTESGWQREGLPIEHGVPPGRAYEQLFGKAQ